jgi:hypothetical protein
MSSTPSSSGTPCDQACQTADDISVRSGNGWTIVDTARIQQTPGAHDIGARLGIAEGTMILVILRAAERWAPDGDAMTEGTLVLHREGRMLVELTDGSTQPLDAGRERSTTPDRSLARIVNIGSGLAKALVITQVTGPAIRGR